MIYREFIILYGIHLFSSKISITSSPLPAIRPWRQERVIDGKNLFPSVFETYIIHTIIHRQRSAVATPVVGIKTPFSPLTEKQWRVIRLKKLNKSSGTESIAETQAALHRSIVEKFLTENPGPPAFFPESAVTSFLGKTNPDQLEQAIESLLFFYNNVVRSDKHTGFLVSLQEQSGKPSGVKNNPLLDQLSKELQLRNYSHRTVKNYGAIVYNYLNWLMKNPSGNDQGEIKRYQLYLKETKKFSPRTVNLATAALLFFYNNVLKLPFAANSLPRMKTGRQLPQVYSAQVIPVVP